MISLTALVRLSADHYDNMAVKILPILKAIAPLLSASSGLMGSLGERADQSRGLATDERIKKLEEDMLNMSKVVAASIQELQATVEELREQAEVNRSLTARLRQARILSIVATCVALVALVLAFAR